MVGSSDDFEFFGGFVVIELILVRVLNGSSFGIYFFFEVFEVIKVSLDLVVEDIRGGNFDLSRVGGSKVFLEEL